MDCCARGVKAAAKMIEDKALSGPLAERYAGWQTPEAQNVLAGGSSLEALEAHVLKSNVNPEPRSGRQEFLENVVNRYV
jgi:xylose isomerase